MIGEFMASKNMVWEQVAILQNIVLAQLSTKCNAVFSRHDMHITVYFNAAIFEAFTVSCGLNKSAGNHRLLLAFSFQYSSSMPHPAERKSMFASSLTVISSTSSAFVPCLKLLSYSFAMRPLLMTQLWLHTLERAYNSLWVASPKACKQFSLTISQKDTSHSTRH